MATDEALELAFGEQRPQSRQKQITEDEWRDLMHSLDRIDRRIGRLSHLSVTAISGAAGWFAGDTVNSYGWGAWTAGIVGFVVFLAVGMVGQRDLDQDDLPAWLRGRRKLSWWRRWRRRRD